MAEEIPIRVHSLFTNHVYFRIADEVYEVQTLLIACFFQRALKLRNAWNHTENLIVQRLQTFFVVTLLRFLTQFFEC